MSETGSATASSRRRAIADAACRAREVVAEHDELVTAEAGDDVARPQRAAQALGDGRDQLVADRVPEAVVHDLEVVEVDEEHRDLAVGDCVERGRHVVGEARPVEQAGHRVVRRFVRETVGQELAIGDVLELADLVHRLAGHVADERDAERRPHHRAVGPQVSLLEAVEVDLVVRQALTVLVGGAAVVGVGEVDDQRADELLLRAAEQRRHGAVRALDAPVEVDEPDADRCVVERVAEGFLRLVERGFGGLALGDVAQVRDPPTDARVVREIGDDHVEPAPRAVAAAQPRFGAADGGGAVPARIALRSTSTSSGCASSRPAMPIASALGVAEDRFEGGADVPDERVRSDHHDDVRCVLHQRAEPLLALAQLGLDRLGFDGGAVEELDRERHAERGEHCQAVHERLLHQRGRDPGRDRELADRQRGDAEHHRGTTARRPERRMPSTAPKISPIASIGPQPIAYMTAVMPNSCTADARPHPPPTVGQAPERGRDTRHERTSRPAARR